MFSHFGFSNICFGQQSEFKLRVGDQYNNKVQAINQWGHNTYVVSSSIVSPTLTRVYLSKINSEGNKIWSKNIGDNIEVSDFVFTPTSRIILVGRTIPFSNQSGHHDNKSVIILINSLGNILQAYTYDQDGREGFEKIIKHKNPQDNNNQYYVVGVKNPPNQSPSHIDQVYLLNLDHNLNINWSFKYEYSGSEEFHRGLIDLHDGNIVLLGNDEPSNNGIIIKVNGLNGDIITGLKTDLEIDFLDAVSNNNKLSVIGALHNSDSCHATNTFGTPVQNDGCLVTLELNENLTVTKSVVNPFYNPIKDIVTSISGNLVPCNQHGAKPQVLNVDLGYAGEFMSPNNSSKNARLTAQNDSYISYVDNRSAFYNFQSLGGDDIFISGANHDFYQFWSWLMTIPHDACSMQNCITWCSGGEPADFRKINILPQNIIVTKNNYQLPSRNNLSIDNTDSNLVFTNICIERYDPSDPQLPNDIPKKASKSKKVLKKRNQKMKSNK